MIKPVCSQVSALSAWIASQTMPDCKRCIFGILCYNLKSQTNILASYERVKAEI